MDEFDQTPEHDSINGGPNNLRAWRERAGFKQEELAAACGTTQGMIAHLEADRRGLTAKWLRKLAPLLNTTPGLLMDHDPNELDEDLIEFWTKADKGQKRQLVDMAKVIVGKDTGTHG